MFAIFTMLIRTNPPFYNKTLIAIASYSEERPIYRTLIIPTRTNHILSGIIHVE